MVLCFVKDYQDKYVPANHPDYLQDYLYYPYIYTVCQVVYFHAYHNLAFVLLVAEM